jgi:PKHD-type hydroxylase
MLLIKNVLNSEQLARLLLVLEKIDYVDGARTAGPDAKEVKVNLQAKKKDPNSQAARLAVCEVLVKNPDFQSYAQPRQIGPMLFSRYKKGMKYGKHVDNAIMQAGSGQMRTDLSFTIFLSDPESYGGGELKITTFGNGELVKADRGDMVIYPSGSLHEVLEVTSGVREVAVGWVQSFIKNTEERQVMFDISRAQSAMWKKEGKTEEYDLLSRARTNLMRMWATP